MLKGLRIQLTLLYLLASLALIVSVGGGIYHAMHSYFQKTTDLALQHKMLHEFQMLGATPPKSLLNTDVDWSSQRIDTLDSLSSTSTADNDNEYVDTSFDVFSTEFAYDGEVAAIFVLTLSENGKILYNPNLFEAPIPPDQDALNIALQKGYDWRTVQNAEGNRVRLLTYRLTRDDGPAALQLGRLLIDQDRVLIQLLIDLLVVGAIGMVVMGFGSWWLAGRSIAPAQQSWERQQMFIANASHELRAPLTLMRASTEFALRTTPKEDEDTRELLSDVIHECDHMNNMVEDLLLVSRLDAGKLTIQREIIDIPDLLDDTQRQVSRLANEQQIALLVHDSEGTVWGDSTHLRQVLLILLDNALRHTPPGGTIEITTSVQGTSLEICICDTGSGIDAQHLPHIFERFYRPDNTRTIQKSGAGLGLSIAKALMEAQNGSIAAESTIGEGTTMRLTLEHAPLSK